MKHAGPATLDRLEPVLAAVRALPGPVERKRGVFYLKSKAFLHFHEDPAGLFADLRDTQGKNFDRIDVTAESGRVQLLALVKARL